MVESSAGLKLPVALVVVFVAYEQALLALLAALAVGPLAEEVVMVVVVGLDRVEAKETVIEVRSAAVAVHMATSAVKKLVDFE